jgi:hypothetical protein
MSNATSTSSSHTSRALDLFNSDTLYVGIGQQSPWDDENNPPQTDPTSLEINQLIGLKKAEDVYMVVEDELGGIQYRDSQWRIIPPVRYKFQLLTSAGEGAMSITIQSSDPARLDSLTTGSKVMLQNGSITGYTGTIQGISGTGSQRTLSLDTGLDTTYGVGTTVHWGLIAEGCRAVFIAAWIRYDELPLYPYRVIGVFNRVTTIEGVNPGKLSLLPNEILDFGILELIEYRRSVSRDQDQKEYISVVVEF